MEMLGQQNHEKKKNQELGRHFVQQVTYLKIIGTNNFQKMF